MFREISNRIMRRTVSEETVGISEVLKLLDATPCTRRVDLEYADRSEGYYVTLEHAPLESIVRSLGLVEFLEDRFVDIPGKRRCEGRHIVVCGMDYEAHHIELKSYPNGNSSKNQPDRIVLLDIGNRGYGTREPWKTI